jgi:hypothetical protein
LILFRIRQLFQPPHLLVCDHCLGATEARFSMVTLVVAERSLIVVSREI